MPLYRSRPVCGGWGTVGVRPGSFFEGVGYQAKIKLFQEQRKVHSQKWLTVPIRHYQGTQVFWKKGETEPHVFRGSKDKNKFKTLYVDLLVDRN
jgi:hypothetical protein